LDGHSVLVGGVEVPHLAAGRDTELLLRVEGVRDELAAVAAQPRDTGKLLALVFPRVEESFAAVQVQHPNPPPRAQPGPDRLAQEDPLAVVTQGVVIGTTG